MHIIIFLYYSYNTAVNGIRTHADLRPMHLECIALDHLGHNSSIEHKNKFTTDGIRTHADFCPMHLKCIAFNHSATVVSCKTGRALHDIISYYIFI